MRGLKAPPRRIEAPESLHVLGDTKNLLLGLHGARPRDQLEVAAADFNIVGDADDRVVGVEFAVGALERLRDALHGLDHVEALQKLGVDFACIADQTDDCAELPHRDMHIQTSALEPTDQIVDLLLRGAGL